MSNLKYGLNFDFAWHTELLSRKSVDLCFFRRVKTDPNTVNWFDTSCF